MKRSRANYILAASVFVNLALLALIWNSKHSARTHKAFLASREITNRHLRLGPNPPAPAVETVAVLTVDEPFHWGQLESSDYRVYVANLREIGCPEPTIRDIIVADVRELFSRRVRELVDPVQGRFWELMAQHEAMQSVVEEKEKQLNDLKHERDAMLEELLGRGGKWQTLAEETSRMEQNEVRRHFLDFLPHEKVEQMLIVEEDFQHSRDSLGSIADAKERQAKLAILQTEQDSEIARLLSPSELAEYKLRNSSFAAQRLNLADFEASSEEFKSLVRIQETYAAPGTNRLTPELSQQRTSELTALLGAERLAQYQRAGDGRYQEFYRVAEGLGSPEQAAIEAFDMRTATERAIRDLRADRSVGPDERLEKLTAIRQETERSLQETLGPAAFAAYQGHYGQWLRDIAP